MKIQIDVDDVSGQMFLRSEIATAELPDGTEIDITSVIPNGSLHFKIGKKAYLVSMHTLLDAILGEMEKEQSR